MKAQVMTWKDFVSIDRLKHHFNGVTADFNKSYSTDQICTTSWKQINPPGPGPDFVRVVASVLGALLV